MAGKNMRLGINMNFDNVREDSPQFQCVRDKVDFMVAHTDPYHAALPVSTAKTLAAAKLLDDRGIDYVANFEFQNFGHVTKSGDYDWANRPDGTHRLNLPAEYVKALGTLWLRCFL